MRPISWTAIAIAGIAVLAGTQRIDAGGQHPDRGRHQESCNDATLRGTYGIQIQGTRPSTPGGPIESVVGVVIRDYDGQGQFTQVDNIKGSISGTVPDRPGFGTYQVNADCTAIVQAQPGPGIVLEERLVIVNDGRELLSATILPAPVMVTAVQLKIDAR